MKPRTASSQSPWSPAIETLSIQPSRRTLSAESSHDIKRTHKVPCAKPAGRNIQPGQAVTYTCAVDTKQGACRRLQSGPWTPVRALRALIRQKASQSSVPYATPAGRNIQSGQAVTCTCAGGSNDWACRHCQKAPFRPPQASTRALISLMWPQAAPSMVPQPTPFGQKYAGAAEDGHAEICFGALFLLHDASGLAMAGGCGIHAGIFAWLEMKALSGVHSMLDRRASWSHVVIPLASNRFRKGLLERGKHSMRSGSGAIAHPPLAYKAHLITRSEHRVDL